MQEGCRKAEDILHVLRDRVAELPGTRDRNRRPVIVFPARECSTPVNPDHIRNILQYLHAVTAYVFFFQQNLQKKREITSLLNRLVSFIYELNFNLS